MERASGAAAPWRYWVTAAGIVLMTFLSGACARKTVYIPPEWHSASPAPPPSSSKSAPAYREPRESEAPLSPLLLKPSPDIRERDVPATGRAKAAPPAAKPEPQPQYLASMHLVSQAKTFLANGQPDRAVVLLEQAIQVDGYNGEAFFHLARAWRMKGAPQKALEFSRKAEILFQNEATKLREVYLLQAALYDETNDSSNAALYRQKAAKL